MNIAPYDRSHEAALLRLLQAVPEEERNFFRVDLDDTELIQQWLAYPRAHRLLALEDGEVVGAVAVVERLGWSKHVGELELLVSPPYRRRGCGRALALQALEQAVQLGLTHICVEVAAEEAGLVAMFQSLGFEPEALLRDFVLDRSGESHDLIILTHRVEQTWSELMTLGIDKEVNDLLS